MDEQLIIKNAAEIEQQKEQQKQQNMDYFYGLRAKTNAILPEKLEMEKTAGLNYQNKLTEQERTASLTDSGSELALKFDNALRIMEAKEKAAAEAEKRSTKSANALHINKNDLTMVSALFTGDKTKDQALSRAWLARKEQPKTMVAACLNLFLQNSFDNLDLSTDKKISKNALRMERLSAQYDAVVRILSDHRKVYEKLTEESRRRVDEKLGQAAGLLNYYRMMRSVITDPYYIQHENRELAKRRSDQDTPEQKRLFGLLWMAKGGLKALTDYGSKQLDEKLDALCGKMSTTMVTEEQLKLQKELAERADEIEEKGAERHLSGQKAKGKLDGLIDNKGSVFFRARNSVKELKLPAGVADAAGSLSKIMDQQLFLKTLTRDKAHHRNNYYLDHNFRDIAVMDQVENLGAPLQEMKEAILSVMNVTEQGELQSGKITDEARKAAQKRYREALAAYRVGIAKVKDLNTAHMMPKLDTQMADLVVGAEKARRSAKIKEEKPTQEEKDQLREKIRNLRLKLAQSKFSDIAIYENAKEIMELMKEKNAVLGSTLEYSDLNQICLLAEHLYAKRQLMDIREAGKQGNLSQEEKDQLTHEEGLLKEFEEDQEGMTGAISQARKTQRSLRLEAERDSFDLKDLKAESAHYLFQEEWAKNSKRSTVGFLRGLFDGAASRFTRFLGWAFGRSKSTRHGKILYQESRQKLQQLPQEMKTFGNEGAAHTITHGDGSFAPPVELDKYFKDPMKMRLAQDYEAIRQSFNPNAQYPQCIRNAAEALSSYCSVRGIVNGDTFEMEHAFLDQFRSAVDEIVGDPQVIDAQPELCHLIMKANNDLLARINGNLRDKMTQAEFETAKEARSIYVTDPYAPEVKESNMRYLPLFPHEPNLNDVKQGSLGDCYLVAAVQTLVLENPEAIRDMFHDLGDGNVLVRLYAAYDTVQEQDGSESYRRVDAAGSMMEAKMRPVYVKVRKQYAAGDSQSTDCMWMQLLENAYASCGFNQGIAEVKEDGKLVDLNRELTDGGSNEALMHMTGKPYEKVVASLMATDTVEQSEVDSSSALLLAQQNVLLKGVHSALQGDIYACLKAARKKAEKAGNPDADWEEKVIEEAVRKGIQRAGNAQKMQEFLADMDALESAGRLTKEEKEELVEFITSRYEQSEERIASIVKRIKKNLAKPEKPTNSAPMVYSPLAVIRSAIHNLLQEKPEGQQNKEGEAANSVYGKVKGIILKRNKAHGFKRLTPEEERAMKFSAQNCLTLNPNGIYNQRELGMLRLLRTQLAKKKPLAICDGAHCLTALDTKLHNGKWFVLIRDPFNVYRTEYTTENGELKKQSYGLGTAIRKHFELRNLSPDLKEGFLGVCWYELKDAMNLMKEAYPEAEKGEVWN